MLKLFVDIYKLHSKASTHAKQTTFVILSISEEESFNDSPGQAPDLQYQSPQPLFLRLLWDRRVMGKSYILTYKKGYYLPQECLRRWMKSQWESCFVKMWRILQMLICLLWWWQTYYCFHSPDKGTNGATPSHHDWSRVEMVTDLLEIGSTSSM